MKTITKKEFKVMHDAGELQLITSINKDKEDVLSKIKEVEDKIHEYTKPISCYGDLSSSKDGYIKTDIYISDCKNYIFIESKIDNSKSNNCSWNTKEVNTIAYLNC